MLIISLEVFSIDDFVFTRFEISKKIVKNQRVFSVTRPIYTKLLIELRFFEYPKLILTD